MLYLYIALLFVPALCSTLAVPQADIESVFGRPGKPPQVFPAVSQAVPVTPVPPSNLDESQISSDLDDLEAVDEYVPSDADYDKFDLTLTKVANEHAEAKNGRCRPGINVTNFDVACTEETVSVISDPGDNKLRVATRSEENFLLSPLGLKLAMAILDEAATGSTQRELDLVLDFNKNKTVIRNKFSKILDSLQTKSTQYILNLGSRIIVGNDDIVSQRFGVIAQEHYKTDIVNLDFSQPLIACQNINAWVANNTAGRISDLVDEDDLAGAVLMVINTLFFKGTWRHQFVPNDTKNDLFYVTPSTKKESSFMTVKNKFYFADSERYSAKILRMPYLSNKFAMYIVVPNALTGLDQIFNDVTSLRAELHKLREHLVTVTLPKFQFEYTALLDDTLKEMGIRQAFEDTASFPGIARGKALSQPLKISRVLQRSGIEVNELGSVAYSATEISIVNKFGEDTMSSAEVVANRPFMFFIQDEVTKQLLFMGRLSDPTALNGSNKAAKN